MTGRGRGRSASAIPLPASETRTEPAVAGNTRVRIRSLRRSRAPRPSPPMPFRARLMMTCCRATSSPARLGKAPAEILLEFDAVLAGRRARGAGPPTSTTELTIERLHFQLASCRELSRAGLPRSPAGRRGGYREGSGGFPRSGRSPRREASRRPRRWPGSRPSGWLNSWEIEVASSPTVASLAATASSRRRWRPSSSAHRLCRRSTRRAMINIVSAPSATATVTILQRY